MQRPFELVQVGLIPQDLPQVLRSWLLSRSSNLLEGGAKLFHQERRTATSGSSAWAMSGTLRLRRRRGQAEPLTDLLRRHLEQLEGLKSEHLRLVKIQVPLHGRSAGNSSITGGALFGTVDGRVGLRIRAAVLGCLRGAGRRAVLLRRRRRLRSGRLGRVRLDGLQHLLQHGQRRHRRHAQVLLHLPEQRLLVNVLMVPTLGRHHIDSSVHDLAHEYKRQHPPSTFELNVRPLVQQCPQLRGRCRDLVV
mmetsp:Transcript_86444/g.220278  ORF Transcript_86444/g.220278 Transcript_86444/m.220278 type:complete len:249 (+) Transcript_86444:257-1003(+)